MHTSPDPLCAELCIRASKSEYSVGETLTAEVWLKNDTAETVPPTQIGIYIESSAMRNRFYTVYTTELEPKSESKFGEFSIILPDEISESFKLIAETDGYPKLITECTMTVI